MEDKEIIRLLFLRSENALSELAKKYEAQCRRISFNILNDSRDVEECVNDAYLGVWNTIPPKEPDPLSAYVFKIVKNLSLNKYRYKSAKKRNSQYEISLNELEECIPDKNTFGNSSDDELNAVIKQFLGDLDQKSRIMFMKRYWFAESMDDIAREFHLSHNALKVKLFRLRKRLKKCLEKEGIIL